MKLLAGFARRRRAVAALVALATLLVAVTVVTSLAQQSTASLNCPAAKRDAVLRQEQSAVLAQLGPLTELRGQADIKALAAAGFPFLAHQFTSFRGIGLTVFNPAGVVKPGSPNFLFYAPSAGAKNTKDPRGPDFPYTLAGWGYGVPYAPDHLPSFFPCMGTKDWHIHERGIHPLNTGGMIVMPPAESTFGASAGALSDPPALRPVVGFPHPRSWTIHLWRDPSGVARSGILDPDHPPSGIDPGVGSSFYFLDTPPKFLLERFANLGRPFAVDAGEGQSKAAEGGEYTLKAAAFQTGGALSVLEALLPTGAKSAERGKLDHDEGWYVLSGQMTFKAGGQTLPARKGSFVFLPAGVDYSFEIPQGTARALIASAPGGIENELGFPPPPPGVPVPSKGTQQTEARATRKPFVLQPGEGEEVKLRGNPYVFKATAQDTGGSFALMELNLKRGTTPGPHIHHKESEAFYLLDGEATFVAGGQTLPAQSGGLVFLPRGLPHVYSIDGDGTARLLLIAAPAGLEQLFRDLSKVTGPPSAAQSAKSGVEPVLPPGAQPAG